MPSQRISERGKRALRVITVAAVAIVASSIAWLYPTMAPKTTPPAAPLPTPWPTTKPGDVVSYQFVNPSVGWAAGIDMYGRSPSGRFWVSRTTDGAKRWQRQLQGQTTLTHRFGTLIQFFDLKHGFISVGKPLQVHRTVDGLKWTPIQLPDTEASIATFSDASHGWLLSGAYPDQSKPVRLYRTNDGGDSWMRLPDLPDHTSNVVFRSAGEGWLWTASQGDDLVYTSRDGGQTWEGVTLPEVAGRSAGQKLAVTSVRLLPARGAVLWLVFTGERGVSLPLHEFKSFDIGRSWQSVPPLPDEGSRLLRTESYQDATHWWASLGVNLYKSTDAGQTWKLVQTNLENGDNWRYSVEFLDPTHAFAQIFMGQVTGLVMTSDGGLHWNRANVPEPAS